MLNEYGDFITIEELCNVLDIGKNTAYELLRENQIKNFRIGKKYKITRDAVVDFIFNAQMQRQVKGHLNDYLNLDLSKNIN